MRTEQAVISTGNEQSVHTSDKVTSHSTSKNFCRSFASKKRPPRAVPPTAWYDIRAFNITITTIRWAFQTHKGGIVCMSFAITYLIAPKACRLNSSYRTYPLSLLFPKHLLLSLTTPWAQCRVRWRRNPRECRGKPGAGPPNIMI